MNDEMITCQLCGETIHMVSSHLAKHEGYDLERYKAEFPTAEVLSAKAKNALAEQAARQAAKAPGKPVDTTIATVKKVEPRKPFHEVFGFKPTEKDAMSSRGTPIPIRVFDPAEMDPSVAALIPERDPDYVFDVNLAKTVVMALEMRVPVYLWGHAGVGKTTMFEQVSALTNRPYTRVQHTANMEEADVEGRWIVDAAGTMVFEQGPLADAMEFGHIYCADEYDFASPMVLSVYQAVLEGKPLFIKAAKKKIYPHENFRFVASGNTNGAGDESGLYQGTMMQNAANYERFGVVERVNYMPKKDEIKMLTSKTNLVEADAAKIVDFATKMREGFDKNEVSIPMSPRSTLNAAKLGMARNDMKYGIQLAYINRLPKISGDVAKQTLQRIFG